MINLSQINSKLKSREKRAHQSVSREQVECAKLNKQVSKLTAQIDQLATDLKKAKAASANLVPAKQSPGKPIPANARASRKVAVDGETVTLGPGEELCSLVVPRLKKKI